MSMPKKNTETETEESRRSNAYLPTCASIRKNSVHIPAKPAKSRKLRCRGEYSISANAASGSPRPRRDCRSASDLGSIVRQDYRTTMSSLVKVLGTEAFHSCVFEEVDRSKVWLLGGYKQFRDRGKQKKQSLLAYLREHPRRTSSVFPPPGVVGSVSPAYRRIYLMCCPRWKFC